MIYTLKFFVKGDETPLMTYEGLSEAEARKLSETAAKRGLVAICYRREEK